MRKSLIAGTVAVGTVLSLGLAGWGAQRGMMEGREQGRGPEQMAGTLLSLLQNDRVKTELGLSDQQVTQLRKIVVDTEKSAIQTRAQLAVRGIELREMLRGDNPDRAAIEKKVQEISDLRGQMMKQHIEALLQAKSVLTPEQQKKIETFLEHRRAMGMGRERFGGPRPTPGRPPAPPKAPSGPPSQ